MRQSMNQNTPKKMQKTMDEISSLNIENLDVQELERRLELASASPDEPCWILGKF